MAHPIRPESYIAMDNFYTATVYGKDKNESYHRLERFNISFSYPAVSKGAVGTCAGLTNADLLWRCIDSF